MNSAEQVGELNEVGWRFDNTYARLPRDFFVQALPAKVPGSKLIVLNHKLARDLSLQFDQIPADLLALLFAGQQLPPGSQPIAQAYAGHQYGYFTMLGDGRAILLGEHIAPNCQRIDIQLKGAGQTQFSRRGDGRAALGPMLREYIISEAMFALGIPTTRSLAVVTTGESIFRETRLQGAILTRIAASHIRVGTFEYAAATENAQSNVQELADYTINRHFPELLDSSNRYEEFFRAVMNRQAALIAKWQLVGFIHGVMNTDNMAISGETIDYGPCAFMNSYRPSTVFSSIDRGGRYAYGNQPAIAQWNLARFAESLLPLLAPDQEAAVSIATNILEDFSDRYRQHWLTGMCAKLGLAQAEEGDRDLVETLLSWMEQNRADFTNTFRKLSDQGTPIECGVEDSEFQSWHSRWLRRLGGEGRPVDQVRASMKNVNPAVIPRNHRVEEALAAAENDHDFSLMHQLLGALNSPFEDRDDRAKYQEPPEDDGNYRTFCGT